MIIMVDAKKILNKIMGDKPKNKEWMFEDSDNDGVDNFKDCEPNNPNEQGFIHKAVNFVRGRGYQDIQHQEQKRKRLMEKQRDIENQRRSERIRERAEKAEEKAAKQRIERNVEKDVTASERQEERQLQKLEVEKRFIEQGYGDYKGQDKENVLSELTEQQQAIKEQEKYERLEEQTGEGLPYQFMSTMRDFGQNIKRGMERRISVNKYSGDKLDKIKAEVGATVIGLTKGGIQGSSLGRVEGTRDYDYEPTKGMKSAEIGEEIGEAAGEGAWWYVGGSALKGASAVSTSKYLKYPLMAGRAYTGQKQGINIATAPVAVGEIATRKKSQFDQDFLESSVKSSRDKALYTSEDDRLIQRFGSGASIFVKDKEQFEGELRKLGKEKGYSGQQLESFVKQGKRLETWTGAEEIAGYVGIEKASEKIGRTVLGTGAKIAGKKLPWKLSKETFKNIAPIGVAEGFTGARFQQDIRGDEANYKQALVAGGVGGLFAGGTAGIITGTKARSVLSTGPQSNFAGKISRGFDVSSKILDPYEQIGDWAEDAAVFGRKKLYGGETSTPQINTKTKEFSVEQKNYKPGGMFRRTKTPGISTKTKTATDTKTDTDTKTQTSVKTNVPTAVPTNVPTSVPTNVPTSVNVPTPTPDKGAFPFLTGKLPGQGRGFDQAQFMSGFTTAAKVKDFAALRRQQANKQSPNKKIAKKIGKSLDFKKKKLKGKWI